MNRRKIPEYPFPNPYKHRIIWLPFMNFVDLDIVGHIILNKDKTYFKIMLWQALNGDMGYYRGQNVDYPTFLTSWQKLKTDFEKCISWIQKEEFIDWFLRTPYFEHFANRIEVAYQKNLPEGSGAKFCFDFEAIAQHYGFATNYLDITTKKDVAEFFAYTYIDKKTEKYKPIEDFNKYNPHLYWSFASKNLNNPYNHDIKIVGFQPLLRPILQYAMALDYENPTINYDKEFSKINLPEEKAKAFKIFDKFNGGEEIFPSNDYAAQAATLIKNKVEKERIINNEIFTKYCKEFNKNPEDIDKILLNKGFNLSNEKLSITDKQSKDMQKHIDKILIPWIKEFVTYSPRPEL